MRLIVGLCCQVANSESSCVRVLRLLCFRATAWPLRSLFARFFCGWLLIPGLGPSTPFVLLAITISAWYGGLGTGLTSTLLISVVAITFPAIAISTTTKTDSVVPFLLTILIIGSIISVLIESLRRAQRKAERTRPILAQTNEQFDLLVNSAHDYGIFMLDSDGHIQGWNESARQIKGYLADEIIGRHFSVFYPAEDIAAGKPEMELKVARETGKFKEEGWRLRQNGARFWANCAVFPK